MSANNAETVDGLMQAAAVKLNAAGIEGARRDARVLLAHAIGCEPGDLPARGRDEVDALAANRFGEFLKQRLSGKPVFRILGAREFFGRLFAINDDCLEPRPETELLVERVIDDFRSQAAVHFCDVGTGSGVIAVTLLCELDNATAIATDISSRALAAAHANAVTLGVARRVELHECDVLKGVSGHFDFIVSNPPYIPTGDIAELSWEVRAYDPAAALDGGEDGLAIYRKLLIQAPALIKSEGRLYLETGHGQHDAICAMAEELGWGIVDRQLDLSALERIVVLERPANQGQGDSLR